MVEKIILLQDCSWPTKHELKDRGKMVRCLQRQYVFHKPEQTATTINSGLKCNLFITYVSQQTKLNIMHMILAVDRGRNKKKKTSNCTSKFWTLFSQLNLCCCFSDSMRRSMCCTEVKGLGLKAISFNSLLAWRGKRKAP